MEFAIVFLEFSLLVLGAIVSVMGLFFLQLCWSWHRAYFQ